MTGATDHPVLENLELIASGARSTACGSRCMVAPSPELRDKIKSEVEAIEKALGERDEAAGLGLDRLMQIKRPKPIGFNDGLIIPGAYFPVGTPPNVVRSAAADRAPLRGTLRVIVVLVDFDDENMTATQSDFDDLFFSTGVLPDGSVREYFTDVSNGLVDVQGAVVGPYRMPQDLADYANGQSGTGNTNPNARDLAKDAAMAADPDVNYGPYDNDGDGFVDAFIVVHAGRGAEQTGDPNDIWSHKWVLKGGAYSADGTNIYGYLTVPEDARIGVCAHELGHLLFGWPDLYDTDGSSEGIGNWCLMAGGSWNGGGDVPAHPSAWCKADQGWVSVINHSTNQNGVTIEDVKTSHEVHRVWKDGAPGSEYFLVENRQQDGFDAQLPGEGLLIWHIDDAIATNTDEVHPKVALEQADAADHLGAGVNRGDDGDPYPGSANNTAFTGASSPDSKSYAGTDTCVAVKNIGASGPVMTADIAVQCKLKEFKEFRKEIFKEFRKEIRKEVFFDKRHWEKRPEKPIIDKRAGYDKNPVTEGKLVDKFVDGRTDLPIAQRLEALEARLGQLESRSGGAAEPFIGGELRPDLSFGALASEPDIRAAEKQLAEGSAHAKRSFDTKQRDS